ncbi:MAG: hypothetical protein SOW55_02680 [Bacilli bacterium]|nr:hypothetical protein [Bacillales bacterium]MDY2574866.1 hypothetical protein [Bacilli bacterium]
MKKLIKIIVGLISTILVIAIILVGVACFSLIDNKDKTPIEVKETEYVSEEFMAKKLYQSINNVNEDEEIYADLSDEEINVILYNSLISLNIPEIHFTGAYVKLIEEQKYEFKVSVKASFFPTSLSGKLVLNQDEDNLIFKFEEVKVGKVDLTFNLLKKFVYSKIDTSVIESSISTSGIDCKLDLENLTLSVSKKSLISLVESSLSEEEIYKVMIETIFSNKELLNYDLGKDNKLGVSINTSSLKYVDTRDGNIKYSLNLQEAKNKTLNDSNFSKENASLLFNYYVSGYASLEDSDKEKADELGLNTSEKGVKNTEGVDVGGIIASQFSIDKLPEVLFNQSVSVSLSEENFNQLFSTQDIIGKSIVFFYDNDFTYITLESLNIDIENAQARIYVTISINGYRLVINANFDFKENESFFIIGTLKSLYLGSVQIEEKYFVDILTYLNNSINENWISFIPSENKMKIDLESFVSDNELVKKMMEYSFSCTSKFEKDNLVLTYKSTLLG